MLSDLRMRDILAEAFSRRFGRAGTRCELQCLQAVAWLETSYGSGWRPPGADSKNLGACQAGASWRGQTFTYIDTHPTSTGASVPYSVAFRFYDSWEQAADDLVKIVYVNAGRSAALAAASVEDTAGFSKTLHDTGYYEGFGATVGERISHHHDAVMKAIRRQAKALSEALPHDVQAIPEPPPSLRLGAKSPWVRILQERLRALGHGGLTVDGGFGPRTLAALQEFQTRKGLLPDGVCGQKTWLVLGAP